MCNKEISFKEKQQAVQDVFLDVIRESVSSPIVRVLRPEERTLTEQEMERMFVIYNGFVYITHYKKRSRKTEYNVRIGKYFTLDMFILDLEYHVQQKLRAWIRVASIALDKYFSSHYEDVFIGSLRFDFITKDYQNFIVPNFCVKSNLFLYRDVVSANSSHAIVDPEKDPNRIPFESFINEEWSDIEAEANFRHRMI